MPQTSKLANPALGVAMAALVLGTTGMLLFSLPILGIPISAFGLLFGIIGSLLAVFEGGVTLRWSLGGIAASGLALAINIAIYNGPIGHETRPDVPARWLSAPYRPYVPPPEP